MAFSSYFEATPPRRRDSGDSDEIPILIFRPFASAPKVFFKNVVVGERVSKTLILRNPQTEILEVELLKLPPPDSGVEFSCKKWQISPRQETTLEIIWLPTKEGKSIHSIHLKTNTNARFFFSIVCVSISKKPLKKKGTVSRVTKTASQRVILRSSQSFKKEQTIVRKPSLSRVSVSSKTKLTSKENVYSSSAKTDIHLTEVSMTSSTSFKTEVADAVPCEDDLKNCSSETYDVISPNRNLSLELKEAAVPSISTFSSTKVHCVKKEINMFADMVLSPILPSQSFKPRQGSARETYVLSTPLKNVSEVDKISFVKPGLKVSTIEMAPSCDNGLLQDFSLKQRIELKALNTPLSSSSSSQANCNISNVKKDGPDFQNFNFSPVKENTEINVSGLSEIGRTNQHTYNKATLEISLPSFTPLQRNKHGCVSAIDEKKLENLDPDIIDLSGISDIDGLINQPNSANTFEISHPPFTPLQINKNGGVSAISEKMLKNLDLSGISDMDGLINQPPVSRNTFEITLPPFTSLQKNKDGCVSPIGEKPLKNLDIDLDISDISDIDELIKQPPNSTNTLEVSPPPFTPLQISKHNEISSNTEKTSKNCRNLKAEFSIERNRKAEMSTPHISVHNFEITSLVDQKCSGNDPFKIPNSETLQEHIESTDALVDSCNKSLQELRTVMADSNSNEFNTHDLNFSTKIIRGSDSTLTMSPKKKSEASVSSCIIKSSIETNCLTFSPPPRVPSSRKENICSQMKGSKTFRKPLNENIPFTVNKGSCKETTKVRKVKKDINHAIPRLILSAKKRTLEKTVSLMDTDKILAEHANPSYCITATNVNPFINSAVFCDQRWFDEREKEFVRWLNVLLTPPEQLNSSDELPKVDVADLWKKSCNSELSLAPSRETVSSRYLVNHRLDSVRRKACAMFRLPCVAQVLSKVIVQIEKGIFSVRKDRNIVRDISLKTTAVELLLCYNPLWLRIGLEAIMGRTIPLESNSDRVGLIGFIARNILSDPYLVERYAYAGVTNMFKPGFEEAVKKHILKKFLLLVFFLDYAKENKLIFHNPCLFCKNAQYKESRDLLLAFAREFLAGIGDITKHLRNLGYIVKHKQTYLDEFNYAVRHLGSDLRDGIRLTKVTEIILQESSLSTSLRSPAISKLQKMHNVKLALTALSKAGHVVEGDITAKDIVEGHREKTMSLLWQIIYKFQISRFVSAARTIQNWYRSLLICISRRIWIRKDIMRRKIIADKASMMIQKHWRGYIARKKYNVCISSVCKIQKWYKSLKVMKEQRREYLKLRSTVIKIQKRFREKFYKKKLIVVLKIQQWYRACIAMRKQRLLYSSQQAAARKIQNYYRSRKMIQKHQKVFKEKRNATIKIQQWYRACLAMRKQRMEYIKQQSATRKIQMYYRSKKMMQEHRKAFIEKRNAVFKIQQWYRACLLMREQRVIYIKLQIAARKIQVLYRNGKLMQKYRKAYKEKRNAVLKIQQWYRACLAMREKRIQFLKQRTATQKIQAFYRRSKLMQQQRKTFKEKRIAVLKIQQWYRACLVMRNVRMMYIEQQTSARKIQLFYRNRKVIQVHREAFKEKRDAVLKIQKWYRACILMRNQKFIYIKQLTAVRKIQLYYRNKKLTMEHKIAFNEKRNAVRKIQLWYHACLAMRQQRVQYIQLQTAARRIQMCYRSRRMMKEHQKAFIDKRSAILKIQRWYRACLAMQEQRTQYIKYQMAAQKIQIWYHCVILMKLERERYLKLRNNTIKIQTWYRATKLMRKQRSLFLSQRNAVVIIQQRYKAFCLGRKMQLEYHLKKESAFKIQRWFRSLLMKRQLRLQFLELKEAKERQIRQCIAAQKIQIWYRTCVTAKKERIIESSRQETSLSCTNESLHNGVNSQIVPETREKVAVRVIEKWYHSILQKKEEAKRLEFEIQLEEQRQQTKLRNCATKIQAWWRGIRLRKNVNISHVLPHIEPSKYILDDRFSLRAMYSKALLSFESSPSLSYSVLLNAGLLIESAVRLSPELCQEFLSSSHLDTVILLLGAMNRSLPAENLICVLLKTLTNVLRHPLGNHRVLENERTIPCLVDLTGIWCTKRTEETFCHLCTVWWLLAQDRVTAQILKDSGIVTSQLLKCYSKVKSWNVHTPSSSAATPMKSHLPTLRPWWCSKKTNRPRIFENGKFGIIGVLKKLHIDFH